MSIPDVSFNDISIVNSLTSNVANSLNINCDMLHSNVTNVNSNYILCDVIDVSSTLNFDIPTINIGTPSSSINILADTIHFLKPINSLEKTFTLNKIAGINNILEIKNNLNETKASLLLDTSGDITADSSNHIFNVPSLNTTNVTTKTLNVKGMTYINNYLDLNAGTIATDPSSISNSYARFGIKSSTNEVAHLRQIGPLLNDGSNLALSIDFLGKANFNIRNNYNNVLTPLFTIKDDLVGISKTNPVSQFDINGSCILGQANLGSTTTVTSKFYANGTTNIIGQNSSNSHTLNGSVTFTKTNTALPTAPSINLGTAINNGIIKSQTLTTSAGTGTCYYAKFGAITLAWGNVSRTLSGVVSTGTFEFSPIIFNNRHYTNITYKNTNTALGYIVDTTSTTSINTISYSIGSSTASTNIVINYFIIGN
jgi:hypothetical protein